MKITIHSTTAAQNAAWYGKKPIKPSPVSAKDRAKRAARDARLVNFF